MRIGGRGVLVRFGAVVVGCSSMLLGLVMLAYTVVMGGGMMVVLSSSMVSGGLDDDALPRDVRLP